MLSNQYSSPIRCADSLPVQDPAPDNLLLSILKDHNLTQYFIHFITLRELTVAGLASKKLKEIAARPIQNILTNPTKLLQELNRLSLRDMAAFIRSNVKIALNMQALSSLDVNQHAAYACWALMTPNITLLDRSRLSIIIEDFKKKPDTYPERIVISLMICVHALDADFQWVKDTLIQYDNLYVNLGHVDFDGFGLRGVRFQSPTHPTQEQFAYLNLAYANLQNTKFHRTQLTAIDMMGANLRNADFTCTHFSKVIVADADLTGAIFRGPRFKADYCAKYANNLMDGQRYAECKAMRSFFFTGVCFFSQVDLKTPETLEKKIRQCISLDIWPETIIESFSMIKSSAAHLTQDEKSIILCALGKLQALKQFTEKQILEIFKKINFLGPNQKIDSSQLNHAIYLCLALLKLDRLVLVKHILDSIEHSNCGYSFDEKYALLKYLRKHIIAEIDTSHLNSASAFFATLPTSDQQKLIDQSHDRIKEQERWSRLSNEEKQRELIAKAQAEAKRKRNEAEAEQRRLEAKSRGPSAMVYQFN